jgi:hypothetical protein
VAEDAIRGTIPEAKEFAERFPMRASLRADRAGIPSRSALTGLTGPGRITVCDLC